VNSSLPQLIPPTAFYDISPFGPKIKECLFALEKLIIGPFQRANFAGLLAISHT
jgi:hypothetical protein